MQLQELKDLIISAVVLALVFAIYRTGIGNLFSFAIVVAFIFSLLTLSLAFILHEMGHRFTAQKYGCYAEYKMWPKGLLLALVLSPFLIFAAPGAVMIHPRADLWGRAVSMTRKKMGIISLAGPAMNILLAGVFILLNFLFPSEIFSLGIFINLWLAFFNMIPFPPLDGSKIFAWDKRIWIALVIPLAIFFFLL